MDRIVTAFDWITKQNPTFRARYWKSTFKCCLTPDRLLVFGSGVQFGNLPTLVFL